jgi:hypothetical protein
MEYWYLDWLHLVQLFVRRWLVKPFIQSKLHWVQDSLPSAPPPPALCIFLSFPSSLLCFCFRYLKIIHYLFL